VELGLQSRRRRRSDREKVASSATVVVAKKCARGDNWVRPKPGTAASPFSEKKKKLCPAARV
jgi:hypothetical protein